MSVFSQNLLKLESSNLVYQWTMIGCNVGLRIELIVIIFPKVVHFSLFQKLCDIFSKSMQTRIFNLGKHVENELLCQ